MPPNRIHLFNHSPSFNSCCTFAVTNMSWKVFIIYRGYCCSVKLSMGCIQKGLLYFTQSAEPLRLPNWRAWNVNSIWYNTLQLSSSVSYVYLPGDFWNCDNSLLNNFLKNDTRLLFFCGGKSGIGARGQYILSFTILFNLLKVFKENPRFTTFPAIFCSLMLLIHHLQLWIKNGSWWNNLKMHWF